MPQTPSLSVKNAPAILNLQDRALGWQIVAVLLGTLCLAFASYMAVPMIPVPMTLQTYAVVLVGALYGWRLGGITITVWLVEGALGFPVLAGGTGGAALFLGPTGGYLFAFPLVGALAGWLVERGWNGERMLLAFTGMLLAHAVCLVLGAAWLAIMIGPTPAFLVGVAPFLPGALLKSALAAATLGTLAAAKKCLPSG